MSFKSLDVLMEIEKDQNGSIIPYYKGINEGIIRASQFFNQRVDFYKKYKNDGCASFKRQIEDLLYREQPQTYIDWMKFKERTIRESVSDVALADEAGVTTYAERLYNNWLLDYCFQDLIKHE